MTKAEIEAEARNALKGDNMRRIQRTDLQIVNSGDFTKVGRKHYRHESGAEISFDCMKFGWRVSADPGWIYPNLHSAVSSLRYKIHNGASDKERDTK